MLLVLYYLHMFVPILLSVLLGMLSGNSIHIGPSFALNLNMRSEISQANYCYYYYQSWLLLV